MRLASEYKDIAGLNSVDCEAFDLQSWQETGRGSTSDYKYDLSEKFTNIFDDAELFDPPVPEEGYAYSKPWRYLGVACLESGLDLDGVKSALSKMEAVKAARVEALTPRIRKDRTIRSIGAKAFTTLGKRLRLYLTATSTCSSAVV